MIEVFCNFIIACHYPGKSGDLRYCDSRDIMVFLFHVIKASCDFLGWKTLKVSYHPTKQLTILVPIGTLVA